ncbi:MAG: class I SAM-dependent methyltransferase, partial [Chthoniobacterales bacterium]
MSDKEKYQDEVLVGLDTTDYLRQRTNPLPGDPLYLHLSDLKLALDPIFPTIKGKVLDFGCGGSPYREFFKDCEYHRADFPGIPNLDFEYGEDSVLPVADDTYDFVVSTQVLEHVRIPSRYLNEAFRVLRPNGKIILTTHGFFEEHGAPYDYHRWTAGGLSEELKAAGFA